MDVRLILDSGKQKGRETRLARGIYLVGRSRICQIRPKNHYVSRKHCAIIHRKREVLIQDLGSKTGTYINRVRIDIQVATSLKNGDRIRVGKTKFRIAINETVLANTPIAQPNGADPAASDDLRFADDVQDLPPNLNSGPKVKVAVGEPHGEEPADDARTHFVEDVLSILEDDEEDDAKENKEGENLPSKFLPGSVFSLAARDVDADVEDDSDGNVEFAAPKSSESLDVTQSLPSYASRKDWDVQSVYGWIQKKETFARLDERRAKRKAKKVANENAGQETPSEIEPQELYSPKERALQARAAAAKVSVETQQRTWAEWVDSDTIRPALLIIVGAAFVMWMAWNAWLLISFKG